MTVPGRDFGIILEWTQSARKNCYEEGRLMEEVIALIDRVIEEHQTIFQDFQTMDQVANDAEAVVLLDKAKDEFVPGRFESKQGLQELGRLLEKTEQGIQAHFKREEVALLHAFEKHGDRKLASALHSLLVEHKDLTERLAHSKQHVAKLTSGDLSRGVWEAAGYDMRAYLSHTRKLFETHAERERELLLTLRAELTGTRKTNN
jgi:hemerythrin-like domain-containing protein